MILSYTFILPMSQLQTQRVMTSQIRSPRIFNTDLLYSCAQAIVNLMKKIALTTVLIRFNDDT